MSQEIRYISMILWLLPLIKNYKTNYFYFFVGIALADPGSSLFYLVLNLNPNYWAIFCELFIVINIKSKFKKIDKLDLIIVFITILAVVIGVPTNLIYQSLVIVILLKISSNIIEEVKNKSNFNLFVAILAFYVLNLFLKSVFISTLSANREIYYLYSAISMFGFAIFFTFTNEKSKFLQVNLNKYLANANDDKNNSSR